MYVAVKGGEAAIARALISRSQERALMHGATNTSWLTSERRVAATAARRAPMRNPMKATCEHPPQRLARSAANAIRFNDLKVLLVFLCYCFSCLCLCLR